jgi:hypothetical protein
MKKLLIAAVLGLLVMGTIGTGAAVAATGLPLVAVDNAGASPLLQKAGYYLPDGEYVVTCSRVIVGYTWRGRPIVRTFCG